MLPREDEIFVVEISDVIVGFIKLDVALGPSVECSTVTGLMLLLEFFKF